jgi:3-deoxy-D-manno-octulosonate 8-phosphate phosphatase (KDO 8-P phosphatase)
MNITLSEFKTLVFDFDGVFTDDKVYINEHGTESVACNKADGLGFEILKNYININNIQLDYFILTREKNKAVVKRAEKLKIKVFTATNNKYDFMNEYFGSLNESSNTEFEKMIYVGNDLNDLELIQKVKLSFCPSDAHYSVKEKCSYVLKQKGGCGAVRELIEMLVNYKNMDETNKKQLLNIF